MLAINPGSGTLDHKPIAMPGKVARKGESTDHMRGEGTFQAAKKAKPACLPPREVGRLLIPA